MLQNKAASVLFLGPIKRKRAGCCLVRGRDAKASGVGRMYRFVGAKRAEDAGGPCAGCSQGLPQAGLLSTSGRSKQEYGAWGAAEFAYGRNLKANTLVEVV